MLKSLFKSQDTENILVLPKDISKENVKIVGMGYNEKEKLYDKGGEFTVAFYSEPNYEGKVFYMFGSGEIDSKTLSDMDDWESDEFDRKKVKSMRFQHTDNNNSWVKINGEIYKNDIPNYNGYINSLELYTTKKESFCDLFCNSFENKWFIIGCIIIILVLIVIFFACLYTKLFRNDSCYPAKRLKWDTL